MSEHLDRCVNSCLSPQSIPIHTANVSHAPASDSRRHRWLACALVCLGQALTAFSQTPPSITTPPAPQAVLPGASVTFSVTATGTAPLEYQWYKDGVAIAGATNATYSLASAQSADVGFYSVVVHNIAGQVHSGTGVEISAGAAHSLYVTSDGTLWAMGDNTYGQLGDGTNINRSSPTIISSGVAAVAAGEYHSLFLKQDGTLWAMGANNSGQLGDGSKTNRSVPVWVASDVAAIAAGGYHSLFRKNDDSLWVVGSNVNGQLGDGTKTDRSTPIQLATNVTTFAGGYSNTFFSIDGVFWATGYNGDGQFGTNLPSRTTPTAIGQWSAVAPTFGYSLFLKSDGALWAAGSNYVGQLGDGTTVARTTGAVPVGSDVIAIAAGGSSGFHLKRNGTLWATGSNAYGQLGDGTTSGRLSARQVVSSVVAMSEGGSHTLYLKGDGTLWAMGRNASGQLGDGTTTNRLTSVQIASGVSAPALLTVHPPIVVTAAPQSTVVANDGLLKLIVSYTGDATDIQWHKDGVPISGATTASYTLYPASAASAGSYTVTLSNPLQFVTSTAAIITTIDPVVISSPPTARGALVGSSVMWSVSASGGGTLSYQWFKDGAAISGATAASYTIPSVQTSHRGLYSVEVSNAVSRIRSAMGGELALAEARTFFVKTDGVLWGMGKNNYNELAPTPVNTSSPLQVMTAVRAVASGDNHTLYLKTNGTLWAVGNNSAGQLGDGTNTDRVTPVLIASDVTTIAAGNAHSLFVTRDGTLWAMGDNEFGRLGDGTTTNRNVPVAIASEVDSVAAGFVHSLFLKRDGTLWGMGDGAALTGSFGAPRTTPVQIASGVCKVDADSYQSLFLKTDGTLWGGGDNDNGYSSLRQLASSVSDFSAGASSVFFLKNNGTLWASGRNSVGQLGDGTTANHSLAVQVASDVSTVRASGYHSSYIKTDGTLWGAGGNSDGQIGDGTRTNRSVPIQVASGVSVPALLTVYVPIAITTPPASRTVVLGNAVTLSVSFTGDATAVQWSKDGVPISGATNPSFTIDQTTVNSAGSYSVALSNPLQTVTSTATLTVIEPVVITTDPLSQTLSAAESVSFTVTATGTPPFSYQWYRDGVALTGANAASYTIGAVTVDLAGNYHVNVGNAAGGVMSSLATLTVNRAVPVITWTKPPAVVQGTALSATQLNATANVPGTFVYAPAMGTVLNVGANQLLSVSFAPADTANYTPAIATTTLNVLSFFQAWQSEYFSPSELGDPAISGPAADPDADGVSNLVEYALGTNPRNPAPAGMFDVTLIEGDWVLTYSRPASRAELIYSVEVTSDLVQWTTAGIIHERASTDGTLETWRASILATARPAAFFRVKISKPD